MNKILFFLLFFTLISCFKEDEPSVDQVFLDWNSTYLGVDSITNFYPLELKTALQEVKIVVDSALRDYKIFTPRDYDPSKKYPPIEIYLNSPKDTDELKLKTEILFPAKLS